MLPIDGSQLDEDYFPSHTKSIDLLESQGFFEENPLFRTSFDQLQAWKPRPATQGVFSGTLPRTGTMVYNETDNMWQGKSVDKALADMKEKADQQLKYYERRSFNRLAAPGHKLRINTSYPSPMRRQPLMTTLE